MIEDALNDEAIRKALPSDSSDWLRRLAVFASIDSTNDWLKRQSPPPDGCLDAAVADYQSQGRGRRGRQWEIPPGYGLCLSVARSLTTAPGRTAALTLALGVGVTEALERVGVANVRLKWPNDLVLLDGKLGGILSEVAGHAGDRAHVVAGIGLNVRLPEKFAPAGEVGWGRGPVCLAEAVDPPPARNALAAATIAALQNVFDVYEAEGLAAFRYRWQGRDWLRGGEIAVRDPGGEISGVAAGIDHDGALLVDTANGRHHVIAGDILRCRRGGITETGR